jgi:anti-sigma factor RsiW
MGETIMPSRTEHSDPTAAELADLSALADGTLDPARRAAVEAHIAASPELSALYAREQRVVAALHQARESERAPASLRARIEASRPAGRTVTRRRIGYAAGLAGALAAIALAVVLALPSGAPGGPSVSEAAALAALGANQPAPAPDPAHPAAQLNQNVDDVYFPNWTSSLGWRASGARTDTLGGRKAVTVYYDWKGKRVAYTIVAAPPLSQPAAHRSWQHGTELRTFTRDDRVVVTWREGGATCVLSGTGISAAALQKLAAWSVPAEQS